MWCVFMGAIMYIVRVISFNVLFVKCLKVVIYKVSKYKATVCCIIFTYNINANLIYIIYNYFRFLWRKLGEAGTEI